MKFFSFVSALLVCSISQSAPHQPKAIDALSLPQENRLQALKNQSKSDLVDIAKDTEQNLQYRWRAVTALGAIFKSRAIKELEEFAQSPQWFLRNAAIIGLVHTERKRALEWSARLMNDPALVVRTSAMSTIKRLKGHELQPLLWEKLYDKINFHRGQSLWIRKHIAEFLADYAYQGEEQKFAKMLLDPDEELHKPAIRGLKKITGLNLAKKEEWIRQLAAQKN